MPLLHLGGKSLVRGNHPILNVWRTNRLSYLVLKLQPRKSLMVMEVKEGEKERRK
jgi:hypothetical protein